MSPRVSFVLVWGISIAVSALGLLDAAAQESKRAQDKPRYTDADVARLAARIDEHIARRWKDARVQPAPLADDGEFLRRVYLDVIGRIPHVSEVRGFLADNAPDKRPAVIKRLLASPAYVAHWTNVWRAALLPEAETNFQYRFLAPGFEAWIRKQLLEDRNYEQMVGDLLVASADNQAMVRAYSRQGGDPTPLAFYVAKENKPENIAAATARLFLGLRIECAQCHKHPFANWKREDFWSYAAFFQGPTRGPRSGGLEAVLQDLFSFPEITIPNTNQVVQARFIDGSQPRFKGGVTFRRTLADWITSPGNRFFARAAANRVWGAFLGTGIVDPVDDFGENNQPSHPELLDELAREFVQHEFDIKFLMAGITASRAYQLTSRQTHASQKDPRLFARAAVRGLSGEQLYDSLATATGFQDPNGRPNPFAFGNNTPRDEFLEKFRAGRDSPTERQTSIVQALTMMNGRMMSDATSLNRSQTLMAVAEYPLFTTEQRVEALFLAALSRKPSPKETQRCTDYVESRSGGPKIDPRVALADVFWALLNSSEFVLNH